jgi:hypothetical protein
LCTVRYEPRGSTTVTDFEHLVAIIEKSEAKKKTNNKKIEVCQSILISWMDANQAKIEANCEEWMAAMKAGQERIEAQALIGCQSTADGGVLRKD